jgi:hypothetical protein
MGLGGPSELADYERAEGAGDRAEIESALAGILPDVVPTVLMADGHRAQTVDMPGHDPRNPEHRRFQSEWTAYHESERHFVAENPDAASRLKNARLPQSIVTWAIKSQNPQLLYFLAHRRNLEYAYQLAQLPAHDLQEKLEKLAEILLYDKRIPTDERGLIRAGDLSTDRYLEHRHSGKPIPGTRKQLPRSREDLDADDYISMRQGEKREYRRVRGHR